MAKLILVRHGQSEWNKLGLWTGWTDVELCEEGKIDAERMAGYIKDISIQVIYISKLKRVKDTVEIIKQTLGLSIPTHEHQALNERHYGVYTGKNKWQVKEEVGEDIFAKIRRSWDHPIPEGETMKDVHKRVSNYFKKKILKDIAQNKNVLIGGSGNSLRALVKELENISDEEVANLEVGLGEVRIYDLDKTGNVLSKEIRGENPAKGKI